MPKQTDKELGLFFKNARHEQKLTYEGKRQIKQCIEK